MPKAGAHEVSDPPAIPTASKSQADAKGLSKPTSLRLTLFLSVAILVVAALGIFGALRHDAQLVQLSVKLEEQAAESTKIQRRMGRVAEKAAASNRSIKVLIEEVIQDRDVTLGNADNPMTTYRGGPHSDPEAGQMG